MKPLTIVFFGEDSFSNIVLTSLISAGYNVPFVLSPLYDNNVHKRLELTAKNKGIDYIREKNINSRTVVEKIRNIKPDLLITAHFQKLLKKELIEIPFLGCINLHPSLLPMYRGMSPQHWPIINGDKKTGITVHFIDEGADTGQIILQKEIELKEDMYVSDLQKIWVKEYQIIMCDAISSIKSQTTLSTLIDNKTESYYGKLKESQCEIKIANGIKDAYNLIRGVSMPYFGAYIYHNEKKIIIWRAKIINDKPMTLPGTLCASEGKQYLSFNDGTLFLEKYETRRVILN